MARMRRFWTILGVVGMAAALAGCSGAADDDGGESTDDAGAGVQVSATEFAFNPDAWTASADQEVTATLTNDGTIEHEWVVIQAGTTLADESEFAEDLVAFEIEAQPGGSATGSFTLPAGTYQIICGIPDHFNSGMQGTLTLE